MTVIDPLEHPQILFRGFDDADPRLQGMKRLAGTYRVLSGHPVGDIRWDDWDVLVIENSEQPWDLSDQTHVLAFDGRALQMKSPGHPLAFVSFGGAQYGRTMQVGDIPDDDLRQLVTKDVVASIQTDNPRRSLTFDAAQPRTLHPQARALSGSAVPSSWGTPLLVGPDNDLLAAIFSRSTAATCWALPHRSEQPALWLAAAIRHWGQNEPRRFPAPDPWHTRPAWQTPAEREAAQALNDLADERTAATAAFDTRELVLRENAIRAAATAEQGRRRLLTADGEELAGAVIEALRELGFDVIDVDRELNRQEVGKVEDLHITDPEQPALRIIAEVKGYTKGAKQSDLQLLSDYAGMYAVREGRLPDRRWFIVNHNRERDPDVRPPVLKGAIDALNIFQRAAGLVIDTRELFALVNAVARNSISAQEARRRLTKQRRIFSAEIQPTNVNNA